MSFFDVCSGSLSFFQEETDLSTSCFVCRAIWREKTSLRKVFDKALGPSCRNIRDVRFQLECGVKCVLGDHRAEWRTKARQTEGAAVNCKGEMLLASECTE